MKPAPFEYHRPASLAETFDLLDRYGDDGRTPGRRPEPGARAQPAPGDAAGGHRHQPHPGPRRHPRDRRRARHRRARAAGGARALAAGDASTRRSSRRRSRTSATPRSGRAAPSAAASRWPTPPPSCPPARSRWGRRSAPGAAAEPGTSPRTTSSAGSTRPRSRRGRSSPRSWCRARPRAGAGASTSWRAATATSPSRAWPRSAARRRRAERYDEVTRDTRLVFFGVGTRPVRARRAEAALAGRRADARGARRGRPGARRRSRPARRRARLAGPAPPPGPRAARACREPARGGALVKIALTVNGTAVTREVEGRQNLVDFLRYDLGFTGSHVGCEHGVCGACTVRVDGTPIRGCLMLAAQADGCRVETIEGVAESGAIADAPAGVPRGERAAVRLLHAGHAADRPGAARAQARSRSGGDSRGHRRQLLPLHRLSRDRPGDPATRAEPVGKEGPRPSAASGEGGYIGRSVVRPQTARLVAGRGTYTDDVAVPRLLHAAFVRSPHAHARIAAIDTAEAAALPGVVAVVTGREMAAHCEPWVGVLEELRGHEVGAAVSARAGQGGVAGRAGGRGGGGVARARGGRLRARARDVGAAAAGGGRGGRARARGDRSSIRSWATTSCSRPGSSRATWTRRSRPRTRCTGTPSTPGGTPWSASSRGWCWPTTTRPTRR